MEYRDDLDMLRHPIHDDVGQLRNHEFIGSRDDALAAGIGKELQTGDSMSNGVGHTPGGVRIAFQNICAMAVEVLKGFKTISDLHALENLPNAAFT